MKKLIFAVAMLAAITSCSEKESTANLHISGNIKGLNKGTLYIQRLEDTLLVAIDTIIVNGSSRFETAINLASPEMLYMFLDRGATNTIDNNLMFFAEPGKINIETELETFYAKANITGSKNHELYEEFKKIKSRFTEKELELTEKVLTAYKDGKTISTEAQSNDNLKRQYLYAINFALNNKNHEVSPYIALSEIPDANIKFLDTIQKSMSKPVSDSKYGRMLTQYVADRKKSEQ